MTNQPGIILRDQGQSQSSRLSQAINDMLLSVIRVFRFQECRYRNSIDSSMVCWRFWSDFDVHRTDSFQGERQGVVPATRNATPRRN